MNNNEVKMVVRVTEATGEVSILTVSDVYREIESHDVESNVSKCGDDYLECWAMQPMISDEGVEIDIVYNAVTSYYELHVNSVEVNAEGYEIVLDDEVVRIEDAASLLHIDAALEETCQEIAAGTTRHDYIATHDNQQDAIARASYEARGYSATKRLGALIDGLRQWCATHPVPSTYWIPNGYRNSAELVASDNYEAMVDSASRYIITASITDKSVTEMMLSAEINPQYYDSEASAEEYGWVMTVMALHDLAARLTNNSNYIKVQCDKLITEAAAKLSHDKTYMREEVDPRLGGFFGLTPAEYYETKAKGCHSERVRYYTAIIAELESLIAYTLAR